MLSFSLDLALGFSLAKEPVGDGSRVHGWLDIVEEKLWHGTLVLLKVGSLQVPRLCLKLQFPCQAGEGPWYGPSFGPPPEVVGDIKVRLLKGWKLR